MLATSRLDELRKNLAAAAKAEITDRSYFNHPRQGFRIYRWRNGVGREHTEAFLRESVGRSDFEIVLVLLRAIARDMVGSHDMSFEDPAMYAGSTSKGLLTSVSRFATPEFWRDFISATSATFPPTDTPKEGDDCLMQHLRRAVIAPTESIPAQLD